MLSSVGLFAICCTVILTVTSAAEKDEQIFTESDLAEHDGSDASKPIYLSIKGVVYDVSTGRDFYGKDASYNALVGRDSSAAIAKMSLEAEDLALKHDISALTPDELTALDSIIEQTYKAKYPVVGRAIFGKEVSPDIHSEL